MPKTFAKLNIKPYVTKDAIRGMSKITSNIEPQYHIKSALQRDYGFTIS